MSFKGSGYIDEAIATVWERCRTSARKIKNAGVYGETHTSAKQTPSMFQAHHDACGMARLNRIKGFIEHELTHPDERAFLCTGNKTTLRCSQAGYDRLVIEADNHKA